MSVEQFNMYMDALSNTMADKLDFKNLPNDPYSMDKAMGIGDSSKYDWDKSILQNNQSINVSPNVNVTVFVDGNQVKSKSILDMKQGPIDINNWFKQQGSRFGIGNMWGE